MQHLECPWLQIQLKSGKTLPSVDGRGSQIRKSVSFLQGDFISPHLQKQHLQKRLIENQKNRSLPLRIQLSLELNSSQCPLVNMHLAQGRQGPRQPSPLAGSSGLGPYKTRSRSPTRYQSRCQMTTQLGKEFIKALEPCLIRVSKDLSRASLLDKFLEMNSEMVSERSLQRDSAKCFPRVPDRRHIERTLKVHLSKNLEQIHKGLIPVTVCRSWLAANQVFPKSHSHKEIRNPASLKYWKTCVNTCQELSFLSPGIQQMLEVHIMRLRIRHRWGLPTQAFEPMNVKPCGAQPSPLPRSTISPSATQQPREHSKLNVSKFLGKPQLHPGDNVLTRVSVPTLVSPLPAPSPAAREVQGSLGRPLPGVSHELSEAPLTGQKRRMPPPKPPHKHRGRILLIGTFSGPSLSLPMTRSKPREKCLSQTSKDPCIVPRDWRWT